MDKPVRAANTPFPIDVEAGETYYWCACGMSRNQPFCDGSHKGSGMVPKVLKAEKSETVWLCGCKQTKTGPFCDGSHNDL